MNHEGPAGDGHLGTADGDAEVPDRRTVALVAGVGHRVDRHGVERFDDAVLVGRTDVVTGAGDHSDGL